LAAAADYEGLIHAFLWDGKGEGAQAVARKLAGIEPENKVARAAIQDYTEKQKSALLAEARELTSQRRYAEAIDRYGEYQQIYGSSGEIELMVARLNSWDKKLGAAETAYHNYLLKHPADVDARLELANVQRWIGHYGLAELSYREVLKSDPRNSGALLGLAQVADSRSADPFALVQAYRQVLAADPKNMAARNRMDQLEPLVSPSMGYSFHSFGDSDGYYRGENRFQFSLPLPGNLQLSPYYSLTYFHQYRQVGGGNCAAENPNLDARTVGLSSAICGRNGTYWGNGGGVQTRLGAVSGTNLLLDIGATRFSTGPVSLNARADLTVKLSPGSLLFLDLARRPGVWDLNTVGTLAAGIVGDTGLLGFQTNIGERWRFWAAGGVTRYSAGIGRAYGNNIQRRFSTRLDYSVLPSLRAGYVIRVSTFDKASPYYFSPSRYLTYGVTYSWTQPLSPHVRLDVDGEGGLGQIKRFGVARLDTLEMAAQPNIVWTIYPGLDFHLGYRFSRGRSSAFGSPVYSTGGMEFGLVKSLGERYAPADPTRLDIY
ncbi:MAG: hypothetical protein M1436_04215, partial [Acidobacteria bacterium]|nr:hypothetical protein [Acidobacteriota bacterium]